MACVAEFGIIDDFHKECDYSGAYEPEAYHCVAIDDDILDNWWDDLILMKTYFHQYGEVKYGLARWSVTLIPPESLDDFYEAVLRDGRVKTNESLQKLVQMIEKARTEGKYMIHYGV